MAWLFVRAALPLSFIPNPKPFCDVVIYIIVGWDLGLYGWDIWRDSFSSTFIADRAEGY